MCKDSLKGKQLALSFSFFGCHACALLLVEDQSCQSPMDCVLSQRHTLLCLEKVFYVRLLEHCTLLFPLLWVQSWSFHRNVAYCPGNVPLCQSCWIRVFWLHEHFASFLAYILCRVRSFHDLIVRWTEIDAKLMSGSLGDPLLVLVGLHKGAFYFENLVWQHASRD